jgi:hypothetical protein
MADNLEIATMKKLIGAHHEAGHAALMVHFNWEGGWASAFITEPGLPKNCDEKFLFHSLEQVFECVMVLHAGYFATEIFKERSSNVFDTTGTAETDWNMIAKMKTTWGIPEAVLQKLEADAKALVSEHWKTVEQIAKTILEDGVFVV